MISRFLIACCLGLLFSCKNNPDKKPYADSYDLDKVNVGEVKIFADYSTKSLLEQLGTVYSAHFPKASIAVEYKSDNEVMDAIYSDSVRLIVLMRECTSAEINKLKSLYQAVPLQYTFAYDAIALVKDKESEHSLIDISQLNSWIEKPSDIFVTISEHIGMFQHLLRQKGVIEGNRNLKVVKDLDELKTYLKLNPESIGVLPFSLVSDQYNPKAKEIAAKFRWIGIKDEKGEEVFPSQSTIYTKEWPLVLPYTVLYTKLRDEEGVGFVKFIHTRQASKLILKAGLIPFSMPERSIKVEGQSFDL